LEILVSPPPILNPDERKLVEAVDNGERLELAKDESRPIAMPDKVIHADVIAGILLGKDFEFPDGQVRPVRVRTAGVQLSGARIIGDLNLDDASGSQFTPLSRLSLAYCWFEGKILLRRSHFTSLDFRGSRFANLNASDAFIKGPVDLTAVGGIGAKTEIDGFESYGQCWVVLATTAIAGRVTAAHARLAAPPARTSAGTGREEFVRFSRHARFALDLRASNIESSVVLRPDCVAVGGVCLALAKLDGSIWGNGAKLKAVEDYAFSADYAVIRGSIYFRSSDLRPRTRFHAKGCVSLFACKLGGSLYMEGAKLERLKPSAEQETSEDREVLDVRSAEIGANCNLSAWQSEADLADVDYFQANGDISIDAASIKGDLNMQGASIGLDACNEKGQGASPSPGAPGPAQTRGKPPVLAISGTSIGGDCLLKAFTKDDRKPTEGVRFECNGNIVITESKITNSLHMEGAKLNAPRNDKKPALDLSGTTVGGEAYLTAWDDDEAQETLLFIATGGSVVINLIGVTIAQKLIMNGARVVSEPPTGISKPSSPCAIDAANAQIGGEAWLSTFRGFSFSVEGGINLTGASIKLELNLAGADIRAGGGRLSLQYVEIGTDLNLTKAELHGALDATGAKIGKSVILKGTTISSGSIEKGLKGGTLTEKDFKKYEVELKNKHIERQLEPDFSLYSAEIGDTLEVASLNVWKELPDYEESTHATIDLRALHVGELKDEGGEGWGREVRFWLDGFRYDRLPEVTTALREEVYPHTIEYLYALFELIWVALKRFLNPSEILKDPRYRRPRGARTRPQGWSSTHLRWIKSKARRWMYIVRRSLYKRLKTDGVWERRLRWLDLQYYHPHKPAAKEYSPDAYEHLTNGLNATGSFDSARRISSARLTLEDGLRPFFLRPFWIAFRVLFDYGFSIGRAIATFAICVGMGWYAAHVADYGSSWFPYAGSVLIINTEMPETRITEEGKEVKIYSIEAEKSSTPYKDDVPCRGRVQPLLYALDVFIPVLDLRQQDACSIAPEDKRDKFKHVWNQQSGLWNWLEGYKYKLWNFGLEHKYLIWHISQATYAILGWVLTPLTILTITGFLRRHLEK
jgi:hypothetical protein